MLVGCPRAGEASNRHAAARPKTIGLTKESIILAKRQILTWGYRIEAERLQVARKKH